MSAQAAAIRTECCEEIEDSLQGRFLIFRLAGEDYAIEIRHVIEIIGIQTITQVPDLPESFRGVINLRGKVISVLDMRAIFHLAERDYDDRTCIVVVSVKDRTIGLVVDQVNEVTDIDARQIESAASVGLNSGRGYVEGLGKVGEQVKILLDVDHLLNTDALEHADA